MTWRRVVPGTSSGEVQGRVVMVEGDETDVRVETSIEPTRILPP